MASEWPEAPLGELVQNCDSRRVPLSSREREKRRGPYPYHGATGVMDYVDDFLFEGLHLLVAEDGSVETSAGKPFLQLVDGKFWVNNHAHVLKGASDEDTKFLYYALSTIAIRPFMSGSVQAKLSQGNLNKIPVPYPADDDDRRAIASILGTLDDKIELNRRMSEKLEAMARALFKSWFVDFDPVRAKAAGRETGLPREIADLFPARLVESEIGEVPEGWGVTPIGTSVTLSRAALDPGDYPDEVFSHYSIPAYDAGKAPARDRGNTIKSQKLLVIEGCVLISKLNPSIPRIWLPGAWAGMRQVASTEFLVCSGEAGSGYSKELIYCLVSSAPMLEYLNGLASGTSNSHQRVRPDDFMAYRWAEPSGGVRALFSGMVEPVLGRVAGLLQESHSLGDLRNALLPKLISGKIRVRERGRERGP